MADNLSDKDKIDISSNFLLHSPPGEFNEVFNAVRMLVSNDHLLTDGCASVFAQYNKEQFVPVQVDGVEKPTLITQHNDLGGGRFADEAAGKSFLYHHLRKEASDVMDLPAGDAKLENWRIALQTELDSYVEDHFHKNGVGCVFTRGGHVVLCIESHQFQPSNFTNGRWRSEWTIPVDSTGAHEIKGRIRVQVHYYEDGNVQLLSEKESALKVNISSDVTKTAKEVLKAIAEEEASYEGAVTENYASMDSSFKTLRRQLPITKQKLDWGKIHSYRVTQDMRTQ